VSEFDPIDDWLGTDVELLQPRPGTFDRIHLRARRRKTLTATTTALGAAVVIAAAVVLPRFVPGFLPDHGNPTKILTSGSPKPQKHHRTRPSGRSPAGTTSPASVEPPGQASIGGSSYPPATNIAPTSVTFISGEIGAVLGQARSGKGANSPCGIAYCTAIAGTGDYGQSWYAMDAPSAGPADGGTGVSQVRFLNASDGWAFGPQLYATYDGGARWTQVKGVPGRVIDLATVNGTAYAVSATCGGLGPDYASDCTSFALYSSPAGYAGWQLVKGAAGQQPVVPGALQLSDTNGYLLAGPVLYGGSPSGGDWGQVKITSGLVPACLDGHGHQAASGESGLIAPVNPGSGLYLICQQAQGGKPLIYQSADGGQTWQAGATAGLGGEVTSLAVAPGSDTLEAATSAGLYYSADGRTWHRAALIGQLPPGGFRFAGMTTQEEGVAVPAGGTVKKIFITRDGGQTWQATSI
jgi:photosystem II stability/assembly factor-like uncharacterized protein